MIERKTFPAGDDCAVAVTTERMADGTWAVVASVKHHLESAERVIDLPVPSERFATQAAAEARGLQMGQDWIAENAPRAA